MIVDLPLYEVRSFFRKSEEGEYVVIQTHYTKYVLDKPSLGGNYWERRLQLRCSRDLPYKLYPLKKRISTLGQLARSKTRQFINSQGKLLRHRKDKFYDIEVKRVINSSQIYNGKWQNYVIGVPYPFLSDSPALFLSIIKAKGAFWLFDIHYEEPEKRRIRVKL